MSLVLGLGVKHSCPWPREGLSSEGLSLASDFFVSLALASSLMSSTPPLIDTQIYLAEIAAIAALDQHRHERKFVHK